MTREHAAEVLKHFADNPITRLAWWLVTGLCGLLGTVFVAFVAYYAGDMRDSIDELKGSVQSVVARVDKLERENEIRRAQWEAYRDVYIDDVKRWRGNSPVPAAEE